MYTNINITPDYFYMFKNIVRNAQTCTQALANNKKMI